jgi:hypothetical protein
MENFRVKTPDTYWVLPAPSLWDLLKSTWGIFLALGEELFDWSEMGMYWVFSYWDEILFTLWFWDWDFVNQMWDYGRLDYGFFATNWTPSSIARIPSSLLPIVEKRDGSAYSFQKNNFNFNFVFIWIENHIFILSHLALNVVENLFSLLTHPKNFRNFLGVYDYFVITLGEWYGAFITYLTFTFNTYFIWHLFRQGDL